MRPKLLEAYQFVGFRTQPEVRLHPVEPGARIIRLQRAGKKLSVQVAASGTLAGMTAPGGFSEICPAARFAFTSKWRFGEFAVPRRAW
jgi:hypothetical protein